MLDPTKEPDEFPNMPDPTKEPDEFPNMPDPTKEQEDKETPLDTLQSIPSATITQTEGAPPGGPPLDFEPVRSGDVLMCDEDGYVYWASPDVFDFGNVVYHSEHFQT